VLPISRSPTDRGLVIRQDRAANEWANLVKRSPGSQVLGETALKKLSFWTKLKSYAAEKKVQLSLGKAPLRNTGTTFSINSAEEGGGRARIGDVDHPLRAWRTSVLRRLSQVHRRRSLTSLLQLESPPEAPGARKDGSGRNCPEPWLCSFKLVVAFVLREAQPQMLLRIGNPP
jgi:hypothetical protein